MSRSSLLGVLAGVTAAFAATAAFAGTVRTAEVRVSNWSNGAFAQGSLLDAAASSDNTQQIGCLLYSWDASHNINDILACWARDAEGDFASCYAFEGSKLMDAGKAISPDSYIYFTIRNGICEDITVITSSEYL